MDKCYGLKQTKLVRLGHTVFVQYHLYLTLSFMYDSNPSQTRTATIISRNRARDSQNCAWRAII